MLEAQAALLRVYERELQADCGISLGWYDVLVHLSEAPGRRLRMTDLAGALLLSPSWLSRRVERMEAAGLVRRSRATDDRRGVCAELTDTGAAIYRRAARRHARSVRTHFTSHLDADEAATIAAAMQRVGEAARSACRDS